MGVGHTEQGSERSSDDLGPVDDGDGASASSVAGREEGVVDVGVLERLDLITSEVK